jgi:hypothetical protein
MLERNSAKLLRKPARLDGGISFEDGIKSAGQEERTRRNSFILELFLSKIFTIERREALYPRFFIDDFSCGRISIALS